MLNAFRSSGRSKFTTILVWFILGLLVVGLAGFGLGGAVSGLANQNVARVGDQGVETETFVRQVQQQRNQLAQQFQQPITMAQLQAFGVDRQVLDQMITRAALDNQVTAMEISAGDEVVRNQLLSSGSFQGVNGSFDQQAYEFFLRQSGLSAREYEAQVRKDAARVLLEVGVVGGVEMPRAFAEAVLRYAGEERSFSLVRLTEGDLETPVAEPTDADLQAYYEANAEAYSAPETRVVSYAAMTPALMSDQVEVTEEQIVALYDQRADSYVQPERRDVDVIAFGTEAEAAEAKAAIDAGTQSFGDLAEARGLTAQDVSLGTLTSDNLGSAAREVVFGAEAPGVFGPVQSDLGPALYRINAILAAQTRTVEDVREELRAEIASDAVLDEIADQIEPVEDLLAAGATIEEIADETPLVFGELALTDTLGEGLAGDVAFRRPAFESEIGDELDLVELEDGGIAALRLERIDPPAVLPFDEVAEQVADDWRTAEVAAALAAQAAALKAQLDEGRQFASVAGALELRSLGPVTRDGTVDPDLPGGLLEQVFGLETGQSVVIEDLGGAVLVQLDEVVPVDLSDDASAQQIDALSGELSGALANDLFQAYAQSVLNNTPVSVNDQLIDDTLALYP